MANGLPLTSEDLAGLIVDALVDAGIVERACFEQAVRIAMTEIDVRKAMGDYAAPFGGAQPESRDSDRAG
jgi:hypothetical protein